MARLRRDSAESFDGGRHEEIRRQEATGSRTRTSPRKKVSRSYDESHEHQNEEDQCLKPRVIVQGGKQMKLAPLTSTLANRTAKLELDLSTKLFGPPRSRSKSSRPHGKTTMPEAKAQTSEPLAVMREKSAPLVEDDVEESVICDSNASSSDSEDEDLPSPRKFLDLKSKDHSASHEDDGLARDLDKLRITNPALQRPGAAERCPSIPITRPISSSDKENDDRALLRFSPPRLHSSPRKYRSPERAQTPPRASPSKGKLQSPSKKAMRIPTPPLRPSLDAFWDPETVNEWNDQYSPKKEWKSPRKLRLLDDDSSSSLSASPRKATPPSPSKRSRAEILAKRDWETRKHVIAEAFIEELNHSLGNGQVQQLAASTGGVRIVWSKTLNSTAGRANWKRETTRTRQPDDTVTVSHKHYASIELAAKVIDDETRLLNVVAHEFCHLCNFMISGIKDQPHGKQFKEWGRLATKAFGSRGVEVTTKHAYQIDYKFVWRCANEECGAEFKRHSKSIDPVRQTCGACRGTLVQVKPVPRKIAGGGGGYAAFVKENFKEVKRGMPGASQKRVMEAIGCRYRERKENAGSKPSSSSVLSGEQDLVDVDDEVPSSGGVEAQADKVARVLEFVVLDD